MLVLSTDHRMDRILTVICLFCNWKQTPATKFAQLDNSTALSKCTYTTSDTCPCKDAETGSETITLLKSTGVFWWFLRYQAGPVCSAQVPSADEGGTDERNDISVLESQNCLTALTKTSIFWTGPKLLSSPFPRQKGEEIADGRALIEILHTGKNPPRSSKQSSFPSLNPGFADIANTPVWLGELQLPSDCVPLFLEHNEIPSFHDIFFPPQLQKPLLVQAAPVTTWRLLEAASRLCQAQSSCCNPAKGWQSSPWVPPPEVYRAQLLQPGNAHLTFCICKDSVSNFP